MQHVMAACRPPGPAGGMVVDRSGRHRAPTRAATLAHAHATLRCPVFPAHGGPHLNPLAGCGRVRKDAIGAARWWPALPQLYHRTRQVLMAH